MKNEEQQLIKDTLERLLTDVCTQELIDRAEQGEWPAELWHNLSSMGLTLAGIKESAGGSGGTTEDSLLVIRETARRAAPVPIAEHFMVASLLAETDLFVDRSLLTKPATIAVGEFILDGSHLTGRASAVPFARWCANLLVPARRGDEMVLCLVPVEHCSITTGVNIAGEPRDEVVIETQVESALIFPAVTDVMPRIRLMGAATRSLMMSGALESVLELSVEYALARSQFGKPIAKFQAIQQQLAILAGEVAAATMAGHAVVSAFDLLDVSDIAIGKARIGEAVQICTDIGHQVHGAMGYTRDHRLNHYTRRLWSWRDEYGTEPEWQEQLGAQVLAGGADGLWSMVTSRR